MELKIFVLFVAISLIVGLLWSAFLHRIREGYYERVGETDTALLIRTSLGSFRFNRVSRQLQVKGDDEKWRALPFDGIAGFKYRVTEKPALFLEFLTGFDIWDFFGKYRDRHQCHTIALVTTENEEVPLFVGYQYEQREFFIAGMMVQLNLWLLKHLRLYDNLDAYSQQVQDDIRDIFQRFGLPCRAF